MPGPKPNGPGSFWVRHFLPFQITAVPLPIAMQNTRLVQDTVDRPPPGGRSARHVVPFQSSASETGLLCSLVKYEPVAMQCAEPEHETSVSPPPTLGDGSGTATTRQIDPFHSSESMRRPTARQ